VPTNVIAEFCQNHNGDFAILQRMIAAAASAGASHGKIQTIFAADVAFRLEFEEGETDAAGVVQTIKRPYQPEYERLKKLELSYEQHTQFIAECKRAGLRSMTTAFTVTSVPHLKELGFDAIKIASYDCASLPLIDAVSGVFDELVISTGATYDPEIEATAKLLHAKNKPFTFLHCVTIYPTPLEEMNLARMDYLKTLTPSVGLSDHTLAARDGIKAAVVAIHRGASAVERHFRILPEDQSRDGRVSISPEQLAELVRFSKLSRSEQEAYLKENVPERDAMLGSERRPLSHDELLNRAYYRGRFCNKVDGRQIFNWDWPG
jgi:N,N'-diacetyllegionaminate synthase